MSWIAQNLWLIPASPLLAAGLSALMPRPCRRLSAALAIGSMLFSFLLSLCAFASALQHSGHGGVARQVWNLDWFALGETTVRLGWVLDPLTASMLVMVTFVGTLIFIYSVGYMAHDDNFTRFFCFLSLFAAAMLGLIIANNLLLLFMCWELVGLASYLLIGFWFAKPVAAAAAKKAFITTRIGDIGFLLGIVWLYSETGTLLFYDQGGGCLEQSALAALVVKTTGLGMAASTGIALLIFCGAMGKSGQVPLHVWLPDAMEGPTPVSALIHAATMVAAGVFLVARVYPLMEVTPGGVTGVSSALQVVTWVGAITAVFAALIAVAQTDIKRILAYSTVSQLGLMMLGLGVGGVAVGMFHLLTHAFFKALLFLGAGSVIHGCHEEQDVRKMGGLRRFMPVTFATYAVGMMALAGVPLFFSGFWSKDEILHAAWMWQPGRWPFVLAAFCTLLTAFYMTRQVCLVFFGVHRGQASPDSPPAEGAVSMRHAPAVPHSGPDAVAPHESPRLMTVPLIILAVLAMVLGFFGTPVWPWVQTFLTGHHESVAWGSTIGVMLVSVILVSGGMLAGGFFYGILSPQSAADPDPLEQLQPALFGALRDRLYVDELYEATVIRAFRQFSGFCHWFDRVVLESIVTLVSYLTLGLSWVARVFDEYGINPGFNQACERLRGGGGALSRIQNGRVQHYLRVIGVALIAFLLLLTWGWAK